MPNWTKDDLHAIGDAEELEIASRRADGTLRPYVTIWAVRAGDDILCAVGTRGRQPLVPSGARER